MKRLPIHVCRFCGTSLTHTFVDLGSTPLSNAYLKEADLAVQEPSYPLHARVCDECFLVQVESVVPPNEIFSDYAYFSSYSTSWVEHARSFAEASIARFGLDANCQVIEVASNDGYLLRHFVDAGIGVLGIEPAANVAATAVASGVKTEVSFFGEETARDLLGRGYGADLLVGNNVLAHVPDLNDFVSGLALLLKPTGVLSMEFPHLLRLIDEVQFDTIYHEHFSYFSFLTVQRVFAFHGLTIFDAAQLATHGGSLRIYACRADGQARPTTEAVTKLCDAEHAAGLDDLSAYAGFAKRVAKIKSDLLGFLHQAKSDGQTVVAYGAAAKGNTLLNFCGVDRDLISYVVDRSPHKQGSYLPGSRLAIRPPEEITRTKPDFVLILPWNLRDEIVPSLSHISEWGGRIVTPIPMLTVVDPQ